MQIDFTSIFNLILANGKDALVDNLAHLETSGTDYVSRLIDRLGTVVDDYKERHDWDFVKARIEDEGQMFLAWLRSVEVLEEATAERVLNNLVIWAQAYIVGLLNKN